MKNKWLQEFKIALIEENLDRLTALHEEMPQFATLAEAQEAKALIAQAMELFQNASDTTKTAMEQMQKALKFQRSALIGAHSRFDKSY